MSTEKSDITNKEIQDLSESDAFLSAKLETFLVLSRALEDDLSTEKTKTHTLSLELTTQSRQLQRTLMDFQTIKGQLLEKEQRSNELRKQFIELSQNYTAASLELQTYRDRWRQVLSQEESVKNVLPKLQAEALKTLELTEKVRKLEMNYLALQAHALKEMNGAADQILEFEIQCKKFAQEMTSLKDDHLKQIKSSNQKNCELQKIISEKDLEIKILQGCLTQSRKDLEAFRGQVQRDLAKVKAEEKLSYDKDLAWEREKVRVSCETQMREEVQKKIKQITGENEQTIEKLRRENNKSILSIETLEKTLKAERADYMSKLEFEIRKAVLAQSPRQFDKVGTR